MYAMKRMNNDMAVSPIVATLVLIVVAVIGAVAVGTIMGTFSTSVSKQANANQANSASQTEILVAGSTTVNPVTLAAGALYTAANPGIKITSQAIASGAGVQAVGNGVADIGAISEPVKDAWTQQFPNLQQYQIGEGAVVVITNNNHPANNNVALSYGDLQDAFNATALGATGSPNFGTLSFLTTNGGTANDWKGPYGVGSTIGITTVIRADSSGTANTFYSYLGYGTNTPQQFTAGNPNTTAVNGNPALVQTVGFTNYAIGFADYGDAVAAASGSNSQGGQLINILEPVDSTGTLYPFAAQQSTGIGFFDTASNITANWNGIRYVAKDLYTYNVEKNQPNLATQTNINADAKSHNNNISFPITSLRPLIYLTNGAPSADVKAFINYVQANPQDPVTHEGVFQENNDFGMTDIA
jgi:phosphate transport system substrate-binding protein